MKRTAALFTAAVMAAATGGSAGKLGVYLNEPQDIRSIYVSAAAASEGTGSKSDPFKTVEAAVNYIFKRSSTFAGCGEIRVILREGTYRIGNTIDLAFTSNTYMQKNNTKLTFTAYDGEKPEIKGSVPLDKTAFTAVTDENILNRLDENAKNRIVCMSIAGLGAKDKDPENPGLYTKLYIDDKEQQIAQWPNGDNNYEVFQTVDAGGLGDDAPGGTFSYTANKRSWADASDGVCLGYFGYDYRREAVKIASVDEENSEITLAHGTDFGLQNKYDMSKRFKVYNILEELDSPGEWYIDRDTEMLYYYPTEDFSDAEMELAVGEDYMFDLKNAANVTFSGISFKNTCGGIMSGYHSKNNKIENIVVDSCDFENIGKIAMLFNTYDNADFYDSDSFRNRIGNIHNVRISNNIFYNMYNAAVEIYSGDIETTTAHGLVMYNNYVNQPNPYTLSKNAFATVGAVGAEIRNNLFHNTPFHVLGASGSENKITYNEVVSTVRDTTDSGSFYAGRTVMHRNNEYAYNFFYKTNPESEILMPRVHNRAIYFDDGYSGGIVHHNIAADGDKSFFTSGSGTKYSDNISVDCKNALMISNEWKGINRYSTLMEFRDYGKVLTDEERANPESVAVNEAVKAKTAAFLTKFPEIVSEYETASAINYASVVGNSAAGNLAVGGKNPEDHADALMKQYNTYENNINTDDYSVFVNPEKLDFRVKKDSAVYKKNPNLLSEDFDLSSIGLSADGGFDSTRITEKRSFKKLYPQSGDKIEGGKIEFLWERAFDADRYRIIIAKDADFDEILADKVVPNNYYAWTSYDAGKYYWRVYAINETMSMSGTWDSGISDFSVKKEDFRMLGITMNSTEKRAEIRFTKKVAENCLLKIHAEKDGVVYTAPVSYCPTDDKTVYVDMSALDVERYYIVVPTSIVSEHGTKLS